jgi:hypothetical protein
MELNNLPVNLTIDQIRKLLRGQNITLKPDVFNPNSSTHLKLQQETINRIIKSHKKGKGVRLCLSPNEEVINLQGGKIKNPFKGTKKAFKEVGNDIKKDSGVVKRTFTSDKAMNTYKKIGEHAIEQGIPVAAALASMAMGDPTGMSGAVVGNIAAEHAADAYRRKVYKDEQEGAGLFKAMHKAGFQKHGITKTSVRKTAKKIGKEALSIGADVAGAAIAQYTGSPETGQMFSDSAKRLGNAAIESKNGKDALRQMKKEAKHIGVELVDDYIDKNLSGVERDIAQKALAGKYPSAKDLIYDYGNSKIEEAVQLEPNPFMSGYGIVKVKRGKHGVYIVGSGTREKRTSKPTLYYGGSIQAPSMSSNVIQLGSNVAQLNSAQMQNKIMLPSPQMAPPIKRGGSFNPAGRPNYGGSFVPGG